MGAASDPDGNSYLLWRFNEGGNFLIQVDATGQKHWGANISWGDFNGEATSVVYDQGLLYVAKDGDTQHKGRGGLFVYNASSGARVNFSTGQGTLLVTQRQKAVKEKQKVAPTWERIQNGAYDIADLDANLVALASGPDRLYCALYQENKIVALDKKTWKPVATYPIDRPSGLAFDATHNLLYAISGNTILRLDMAKDGSARPLVTDGLSYPFGLALDASGTLWVSVRGRQMQVLGIDRAGQIISRIGKPGGRPWVGKYDPDGMLMPSGISVDRAGQLWVMEYDATPKRVSLWNTKTGKLVKEFFGSAAYAPMMAPDPEKPEEVYIHNTRFIVDYDKGTVKPDATVYRANTHGPSIPGSEAGNGFMGSTFQVARFQGKQFAFNGNGGHLHRRCGSLHSGGVYRPGLIPACPVKRARYLHTRRWSGSMPMATDWWKPASGGSRRAEDCLTTFRNSGRLFTPAPPSSKAASSSVPPASLRKAILCIPNRKKRSR